MAFVGVKKAEDRHALIAYLRTNADAPAAIPAPLPPKAAEAPCQPPLAPRRAPRRLQRLPHRPRPH